jgi:hypothetical protein
MGSLGQEIDAKTIESQNMEQSRNSVGETNQIRVKRRLIKVRIRTVHKRQPDSFTVCSLFQHALATASIP